MAGRRPTVYDVARQAGVSIATVSFAFRRPAEVRAETREAVLRAAQEIGYVPSASARGLAQRRTGALGLHSFEYLLDRPQGLTEGAVPLQVADLDLDQDVVSWDQLGPGAVSGPAAFPLYVDEVQRGFELEARRHGRPVLVGRSAESGGDVTETAGRVDGLAIFPGRAAERLVREVRLHMPVVVFGSPPDDDPHHHVLADNRGGARELVRHLVTVHGLSDLAFVGSQAPWDLRERFFGMRGELEALGLPAPDEVCDDTDLVDGATFDGVRALVTSGRLPHALVCGSDQVALAVLELLAREGVRVPEDIAVTGFDGILAGRLGAVPLTTVAQPMEAMGRVAVHLLMGAGDEGGRVVRLGTRLQVRRSCGCSRPPTS
ncbi:transcriptional regulator, LacI family [Quadrisphaera granulorum]|uniref:LacI family transcriptional regulator n=1 Tax=Quadrisphaera granulorum TaxID=317664 RepID=A0A315ZZB1_9ACTN|nr:LacI family DNA-binding transcriptional regulator [Quadrisphaera granulorum]PWJ50238.1 LacI family transcriptional regulator [Quadrisphaera granulorum]SZE98004.1 transcriptional regulator, LacI family [Quadrisphaera granulorum]